MPPENAIRDLEELSLNAWPALQTIAYDGWLLRFAAGYTKRANSVNPLYPSVAGDDLMAKIAHCETLYTQHGLDCVFKLTPASLPPGLLDAALETRGYRRIDETSVQTLNLLARQIERPGATTNTTANLSPSLNPEWVNAYTHLSGVPARHSGTMERMLGSITGGQPGFLSLTTGDGCAAAVGLAVIERGHVGLFDIVVDERLRGRGLGSHLVEQLLHWGAANGAHTAYLQVMRANLPALALYRKLGFTETYAYWYRVKDAYPANTP